MVIIVLAVGTCQAIVKDDPIHDPIHDLIHELDLFKISRFINGYTDTISMGNLEQM